MSKVSIIIPSRNEQNNNLVKTLQAILASATGEYEVLVGQDGPHTDDIEFFKKGMDLKVIEFPSVVGIKTNINTLAAMATGKYIFKSDAHCSFGQGFDEILQADMQDDWVVMPRFYVLNKDTWQWQDNRHYDYFYLSCPFVDPRGFRFKAGGHWPELTALRELEGDLSLLEPGIDETPQIHGSGWFMTKDRFFELGGFPLTDPYGHAQEPANIALKNWLMGGQVMVNKKTWYSHLHQETRDKGFALGHKNEELTYNLVANYWMKQPGMRDFIKRFMPMPTWPVNWEELYNSWLKQNAS